MSEEEQIEETQKAKATELVRAEMDASSEQFMPMLGNTFEQRFRMCKAFVASRMLPQGFDTPEKALVGIEYAVELGFRSQPLMAMRNIAVINGMPSIWGELPLALVYKSKQIEENGIDEYFIDVNNKRLPSSCPTDQVYAAICKVQRKGFQEREFAFTVNEIIKTTGVWKDYKKVMMKRRARSIALKDVFPDVLLGITIAEYDYNTTFTNDNTTAKVNHSGDVIEVDKMNERFGGEK